MLHNFSRLAPRARIFSSKFSPFSTMPAADFPLAEVRAATPGIEGSKGYDALKAAMGEHWSPNPRRPEGAFLHLNSAGAGVMPQVVIDRVRY